MNLAPSGIGAEPKKLAILIGLLRGGGRDLLLDEPARRTRRRQHGSGTYGDGGEDTDCSGALVVIEFTRWQFVLQRTTDHDILLRPKNRRARPHFRLRRRFSSHAESAGGHGPEPRRSHLEAGSAGQSAATYPSKAGRAVCSSFIRRLRRLLHRRPK